MADMFVLVLFVLLPAVMIAGLWLFFKKLRLHESTKHRVLTLVAGNALVLLTLISIVLPLGEIYFRWIYDASDSYGLMKTHQRWCERHFQVNQAGFRDNLAQYDISKESGKKRLVIIGDSFTAGQGINDIEDTLGLLLRKQLPDWEIHIHAICGWDTPHESKELQLMAQASYEVDAVLLVYCLNDIIPLVPEWERMLTQMYQRQSQQGFLVQNSYFVNFMYHRLKPAPEVTRYFSGLDEAYSGVSWTTQSDMLRKMAAVVTDDLHAKFLVCTFPFLHALGNNDSLASAHQRLDHFWTELGTPHLDLLPSYAGRRPDELMANRYDAHPSEEAIVIAADAIGEFLKANLAE